MRIATARRAGRAARRAGFTLIEMLAVILIIGILSAVLILTLGGQQEIVEAKLTRAQLDELTAVVDAYERKYGAYPPSHFTGDQGSLPNETNVGVEALVVALWSKGYEAGGDYTTDDLDNVDADRSTKQLTDFPDNQLFEFTDAWGNPIAYLHQLDYGKVQAYLTLDGETGEWTETEVRALQDPVTKRFQRHARFQLLSAGIDGRFGTEDDLTNFDR